MCDLAATVADEALAAHARNRCRECFSRLYERYRMTLARYLHESFVYDFDTALDLEAEAWKRAFQHVATYEGERPFKAWLAPRRVSAGARGFRNLASPGPPLLRMLPSRRSFLAGGAMLASVEQGAPIQQQRIGVVDVRKCFEKEKYSRMAESLDELGRLRDLLSQEAVALQKKIAGLTDDMATASPKGDIYVDKLRLRSHAEYDLKLLQEVSRRKLRDRLADLEARVYVEIRRVIAEIARVRNLDLVLRVDEPRLQEEDPEAAAAQRNASRDVLYHADALDITPQVLARLNADWAKAWKCEACKRKVADEKCPDCGAPRR
jgi:Skp family chaperone for outer membrane proteins